MRGIFSSTILSAAERSKKLRTTRKEKGIHLQDGIKNRNALTYGILNRIRCQRRNMMKTESLYIQKQNCMQSGKPLRNFSLYGII